ARDHDIVAARERRADRFEGLSAHDHRVPHGQTLEASEVLGQAPGHAVAESEGAVARQGGDDRDSRGKTHRAIVVKVVKLSLVFLAKKSNRERRWTRYLRKPAFWSSMTIRRTEWPW